MTAPEAAAPVVVPETEPSPAQPPKPQPEPTVEPAPQAEPAPQVEQAPQPVAAVEAEPAPQPETAPIAETPGPEFVVSEELYNMTFTEVETLVMKLNEIIKQRNLDEWLTYLTAEYIERTSSLEFLRAATQSAILKKDKITLKNLKDYFTYVVVPSRIQAQLEDLVFLDASHVKAMAVIGGNPVVLYLLVRTDDRWMIGNW